jgi:cobalt transporter subunit CbtA
VTLRRLVAGGLIGGILGGLAVAAIEAATTTRLILAAEQLETAQAGDVHAALADPERALATLVATAGVAVGYALMLLALMHLARRPITARTILPWAVAGFLATGLAPAFGLAPALPGAAEAGLVARQAWWLATAAATAGGLALLALARGPAPIVLGLALIALPHVAGAPHAAGSASPVPAELAASFAAASLGVQFLSWVLPAAIAGYAVSRLQALAR